MTRRDARKQFDAMQGFLNACWAAMPESTRRTGMERIRAASLLWDAAPSEATWEHFEHVIAAEVGKSEAASLIADLEPYIHRVTKKNHG
jgi:hypothetical protein